MPPSPSLSAFKIKITYLIRTTIVRDQKMRDMTPRRLAGVRAMAWVPWKHSLTVYKGLVPMSPETPPRAPKARTRVLRISFFSTGSESEVIDKILSSRLSPSKLFPDRFVLFLGGGRPWVLWQPPFFTPVVR